MSNFPCPFRGCSRAFTMRVNVVRHLSSHFNRESLFPCALCPTAMDDSKAFVAHYKAAHGTADDEFESRGSSPVGPDAASGALKLEQGSAASFDLENIPVPSPAVSGATGARKRKHSSQSLEGGDVSNEEVDSDAANGAAGKGAKKISKKRVASALGGGLSSTDGTPVKGRVSNASASHDGDAGARAHAEGSDSDNEDDNERFDGDDLDGDDDERRRTTPYSRPSTKPTFAVEELSLEELQKELMARHEAANGSRDVLIARLYQAVSKHGSISSRLTTSSERRKTAGQAPRLFSPTIDAPSSRGRRRGGAAGLDARGGGHSAAAVAAASAASASSMSSRQAPTEYPRETGGVLQHPGLCTKLLTYVHSTGQAAGSRAEGERGDGDGDGDAGDAGDRRAHTVQARLARLSKSDTVSISIPAFTQTPILAFSIVATPTPLVTASEATATAYVLAPESDDATSPHLMGGGRSALANKSRKRGAAPSDEQMSTDALPAPGSSFTSDSVYVAVPAAPANSSSGNDKPKKKIVFRETNPAPMRAPLKAKSSAADQPPEKVAGLPGAFSHPGADNAASTLPPPLAPLSMGSAPFHMPTLNMPPPFPLGMQMMPGLPFSMPPPPPPPIQLHVNGTNGAPAANALLPQMSGAEKSGQPGVGRSPAGLPVPFPSLSSLPSSMGAVSFPPPPPPPFSASAGVFSGPGGYHAPPPSAPLGGASGAPSPAAAATATATATGAASGVSLS